jgi:hypothetical protein
MASSDESIRPEVSMEASICPSLSPTSKSYWDASYRLSQATYTPETSCTRAIDHPRVSAEDLAVELAAGLPTHKSYKPILQRKDSLQENYPIYGTATLPSVHRISEASALRHSRPIQCEQTVQKRNIERDTASVSIGASTIGNISGRHSAMYQVSLCSIHNLPSVIQVIYVCSLYRTTVD